MTADTTNGSSGGRSLNPSRAYLPKLPDPPATILDHLDRRFPLVGREVWAERMSAGGVCFMDGTPVDPSTPYRHGATITYFREVASEPIIPFEETIVFRNEHILVADKPHFLPVVPTGPYVNQSLLARLQRRTGLRDLSPVHRLDLETAGLVLFSLQREGRNLYHRLFADESVEKRYRAVAATPDRITPPRDWNVENRLVPGEPWFRMQIGEGAANARTRVTLVDQRQGRGLFELTPHTGKKHQLRVHLASIGFPIMNDHFYPEVGPAPLWDYARPLQLLAWRLAFRDPVTGEAFSFESARELSFW
jgi:tRNA pseudouridine32 synthase/23S rRNA pseudouridine746 synthase